MAAKVTELLTQEELGNYVKAAAEAAGYKEGFGVPGCDLNLTHWWAAYCRQSLDQQSHNNRLPEYLLTLAKMARDQGVIVPREYIFYDHETGEHLDRPQMMFIRHELIGKRKIVGILFADLRCLSREPAPQQVFERGCEILGIKLIFGDAPSGMDVGSQFARSAITFSNKLARLATNRNARAGNIGRVLKGWVPAHKAPYGYTYRRDADITEGRIQIKKAWWEIDSSDQDSKPVPGSPADYIVKIFEWLGNEGRTLCWVEKKLRELEIKTSAGGEWTANSLRRLVLNHCYTGNHAYNANSRIPNPERPLGDVTGMIKRTLLRPKPAGEAVMCNVPVLVSEELWQKANQAIRERGRGRGKEGKSIQVLLRNRIYCPKCGKPLSVRRRSNDNIIYYLCSRKYRSHSKERCTYRRFVPGIWEDTVWDSVYALLKQDAWIEERLITAEKQNQNTEKLVKIELQKITQYQTKITKIREGFEGGLYSLDEAKAKVAEYREVITKAEQGITRINNNSREFNATFNVEKLKRELQALATQNLDHAVFSEKQDIINKLGVKVYPSEDLKTMRIRCALNFPNGGDNLSTEPDDRCGIVLFGSTGSPRTD